ncbi:rod shape-determining protein MreC, partial [Candidatus Omnitrophota bacterium]
LKTLLLDVLRFPLIVASKIVSFVNFLPSCASYNNENKLLKKEIGGLKDQLVEHQEALQENERLKKLLSFKKQSPIRMVAATVIGRDPSNWTSSLVIDIGSKEGVKKDAAVLVEGGLVGKVVEVGSKTSKVLLINDTNMSVAAVVQRSREEGVVTGTLGGNCQMKYLSLSADAVSGDTVMTSGLGGVFPKGITIGTVVEVFEDTSGLMLSCAVAPAVDINKLEEVLVVK